MNHNESHPHLSWWICDEEIQSLTLVSSHQTIFHQSFNHLFHFHREIHSRWKQIIRYKNLFNNFKSFVIACLYNLWGLAQLLKQHPNPVFAPHLETKISNQSCIFIIWSSSQRNIHPPWKNGLSMKCTLYMVQWCPTWGLWRLCKLIFRGWRGSIKNKSLTRSWI